jgi:hypothetical protein
MRCNVLYILYYFKLCFITSDKSFSVQHGSFTIIVPVNSSCEVHYVIPDICVGDIIKQNAAETVTVNRGWAVQIGHRASPI